MTKLYVFKRLFHYVANYKYKLVTITFLALLGVVFEVAKPLPIKVVIDNVLSGLPLPGFLSNLVSGTSLATDKTHLLYACVALLVVVGLFNFLLTRIVVTLPVSMAQQLVFDLSRSKFISGFGKNNTAVEKKFFAKRRRWFVISTGR